MRQWAIFPFVRGETRCLIRKKGPDIRNSRIFTHRHTHTHIYSTKTHCFHLSLWRESCSSKSQHFRFISPFSSSQYLSNLNVLFLSDTLLLSAYQMMHIKSESPTTILWTETCQHLLCFEVDFLSINNHVLNNNTTTSHFFKLTSRITS